ncbi:hypothetical protein AC578_5652 [Pseudocercospora eumusae]|uniref:Peptidase S8/S53 domain-containing protein n=1 Tax=Pseudocercospora eumusae TaxID=321146 RepID=A0A139HT43_9PEZI|nr:hypothetical protein AC578_5652 [Pseudocercospora eumusae]
MRLFVVLTSASLLLHTYGAILQSCSEAADDASFTTDITTIASTSQSILTGASGTSDLSASGYRSSDSVGQSVSSNEPHGSTQSTIIQPNTPPAEGNRPWATSRTSSAATSAIASSISVFDTGSATTDAKSNLIVFNTSTTITLPSQSSQAIVLLKSDWNSTTIAPIFRTSTTISTNASTKANGENDRSSAAVVISDPRGSNATANTSISSALDSVSTPTLQPVIITTTNSAHLTIISKSGDFIAIPTGISTPVTVTGRDGKPTTYVPPDLTQPTRAPVFSDQKSSSLESKSTAVAAGFLLPVTAPVDKAKPDRDTSVIPCHLWFFNICLHWDDINIFGWAIHLAPGVYPSGPPPPPGPPPPGGIKVEISGTLPEWPKYTIGPDHQPTFPPEPPKGQCATKSAQVCVTRTSYSVTQSLQATVTIGSQVLSTCATVHGCEVKDTAASTTTTAAAECTSASTVTNIWVSCPTSASTSCKTTSTSLVSGCSIAPTTITCGQSAPTGTARSCEATADEYIIYAHHPRDEAQCASIDAYLHSSIHDVSSIWRSKSKYEVPSGVSFWTARLTQQEAEELRAKPEVASVALACKSDCYDPTTSLVYQKDALDHLAFISWPPPSDTSSYSFGDLKNRYVFDDSGGKDVNVYILDSGATIGHSEFDDVRDRVRWLHVGRDVDDQGQYITSPQPEDDSMDRGKYPKAHGTAMLSLVLGKTLGVAKNAHPILVRMPRTVGGGMDQAQFLEGLKMISDDLGESTSTEPRAIVLLAIYYPQVIRRPGRPDVDITTRPDFEPWLENLRTLLATIESKGGLIITGAGNEGLNRIRGWPAGLGGTWDPNRIQSMIVVGGVHADGSYASYAYDIPAGLPHVWAPARGVKVAEGALGVLGTNPDGSIMDRSRTRNSAGTSDAAALTTGLAAYIMKLIKDGPGLSGVRADVPYTLQGIKNYIVDDLSWSRGTVPHDEIPSEDPPFPRNGIYNGVSGELRNLVAFDTSDICLWRPGTGSLPRARRELAACQSPLPASEIPGYAVKSTSVKSPTQTSTAISTTSKPSSISSTYIVTTFRPVPSLLPTLTGGGIETKDGSSCVQTATITQCALGPGGRGSACVPSPTCASWIATTKAPPPAPKTPLELKPPVCNNEADLPGHADIGAGFQKFAAKIFCEPRGTVQIGPSSKRYTARIIDPHGVNYDYEVSWIQGCVTTVEKQSFVSPVPGHICEDIMRNAYKNCNNGGVGGYIDAGCVRYSFVGGR